MVADDNNTVSGHGSICNIIRSTRQQMNDKQFTEQIANIQDKAFGKSKSKGVIIMDQETKEYINKYVTKIMFLILSCTCLILTGMYSLVIFDNSREVIRIINIVSMVIFLLIAISCMFFANYKVIKKNNDLPATPK